MMDEKHGSSFAMSVHLPFTACRCFCSEDNPITIVKYVQVYNFTSRFVVHNGAVHFAF